MPAKPETTLDRAKEAYEKILRIQNEFATFPPTAEMEAREHDRVYWERVAVIKELLDD